MNIIKDFAPVTNSNIPNLPMDAEFITTHNTGNTSIGANAELHNRYIKNGAGGRMASWHFTIDEDSIYQHIPTNRSAWHCTDGYNGTGNRKSIGIEICMHRDQKDYKKAEKNAIWLINELRNNPEKFEHKNKIKLENIVPHFRWYNKNCPSKILNRWDAFIKEIYAKAKPTDLVKPVVFPEGVHIVSSGESLSVIASKYDTTVKAFATLNGISNPNIISIGQRLDIPKKVNAPDPKPITPSVPNTYKVKAGDSLSVIASRYGLNVNTIASWNNVSNPSLIQIGQVLHLKGNAPKHSVPTPKPQAKPTPQPVSNAKKYTLAKDVAGYKNSMDAKNGKNRVATARKGVYFIFNEANGMLNLTKKEKIAGVWISSKDNTATPNTVIKVGSRVKIKASARTYTTGQSIPSSVKGKYFTISQIKNDSILLKEILSWVRKSDIE